MVSIIDRWRNRSWSSRGSVRCFMFLRRGVISSRPGGPQLVKERLGDVALVAAELAKAGRENSPQSKPYGLPDQLSAKWTGRRRQW